MLLTAGKRLLKPFIPIFLLLKVQIKSSVMGRRGPVARRDLPAVAIVLRAWRCLLAKKMRVCFAPQPSADAQPLRTTEFCKKGLELDWDWVVLFCSSAN